MKINRSDFTKSHAEYFIQEFHKKYRIKDIAIIDDAEVSIFLGLWEEFTS